MELIFGTCIFSFTFSLTCQFWNMLELLLNLYICLRCTPKRYYSAEYFNHKLVKYAIFLDLTSIITNINRDIQFQSTIYLISPWVKAHRLVVQLQLLDTMLCHKLFCISPTNQPNNLLPDELLMRGELIHSPLKSVCKDIGTGYMYSTTGTFWHLYELSALWFC